MKGGIQIRGARTHNLKGFDVELPHDALIVITGLSGSGKSSLAFDTLFAEGQRRYVESLSAYARQFLSVMDKPDVEHIDGLSPAISIEQKATSHNPRSTVGTITEVLDYLRLLFARVGTPRCPLHQEPLEAQSVSEMVDAVMAQPSGVALALLAPVVVNRKGDHAVLLDSLRAQGYLRARVDGTLTELDGDIRLDARRKHDIDVVVDRFKVRDDLRLRLAESFETALGLGEGSASVVPLGDEAVTPEPSLVFSSRHACRICGYSVPPLEPRSFSFNAPQGACPDCDGLGVTEFFDPDFIVTDASVSLAAGAVRGWDRRNGWYFQMLQSLARHYDFDVDTVYDELPARVRDVVLYGSGKEDIVFSHLTANAAEKGGSARESVHPFEGVIPTFERRYRETESAQVREELGKLVSRRVCPTCHGARLNEAARHVRVADLTLPDIAARPIDAARSALAELALTGQRADIADKILREVLQRLDFLINVGLDYLSLDRAAASLSGGESQRIRLASQIGAGLQGVMYVLDEPSIGLHQRDNDRLLDTLRFLRDLGNTVIVVEHDEDAIRAADHVLDIGPGAGVHGGEIVAAGSVEAIMAEPRSLTGQYLAGKRCIEIPERRAPGKAWITLEGASGNNLKSVDLELPVGLCTAITGVSGSGKSTLINDTLLRIAATEVNRARDRAAPFTRIAGLDAIDKIVAIDQSPIGRTPRSNPATYSGLFSPIRDLFAGTREARSRGYEPGRFSFNVKGGRCEACQGDGLVKVEMHFLPDVYVSCDVCRGQRYNRETLDIRYKGLTIHDVLELTVERAAEVFAAVPTLSRKLDTLMQVGLSYITLGQSAVTLSGGEAQRIKLARELSKQATGRTLYVLDEPTTGLHFEDVRALLAVLRALRDAGNTLIVIEHNLDVIKTCDWVVDLGPEGGAGGGTIVVAGTPETVAECPDSHTARYLAPLLTQDAPSPAKVAKRASKAHAKARAKARPKTTSKAVSKKRRTV